MDTRSQLRAFILKNFYVADPAALTDGMSLLDKGIIDSTGVLELTAYIEETFGISVADEELLPENLDSIDNLDAFVTRKKS